MNQNQSSPKQGHQFGTFAGVYTPALLTILGLVMFMRINYVLGSVGLRATLVILIIGGTITLATGLAIAAISTNTDMGGGGAYFLISRVLGPSFGTSIGLTLFLSQTLAIAFNILGASESLVMGYPALRPWFPVLNLAIGLGISLLVWKGADWAIKAQYVIMGILGLSLLVFLLGPIGNFSLTNLSANWLPLSEETPLIPFFAIFFPAVTGIMAGVNMSGDLRNPHRSIPVGTLAALGTAILIYLVQIIMAAACFDRHEMIAKPYLTLVNHALFGLGFMVLAGVQAATLSTALGWMLGAPRVLQSLGVDNVLPGIGFFRKGVGQNNEPRRAMVVVVIICLGMLLWSGLAGRKATGAEDSPINFISVLVSMFFLFTYAIINVAAFVESSGRNPSFRPRFRYYHWSIALYGIIACIAAALMINWKLSLTALMIISLLYFWTRLRNLEMSYGDARRGFIYSRIRNYLLMLQGLPVHAKNWRPTIAVLCGAPDTRGDLVDYAILMSQHRGLISVLQIVESNGEKPLLQLRNEHMAEWRQAAANRHWSIFPEVIIARKFDNALQIVLQSHSLAPIKPNIIMMGWPYQEERLEPFFSNLRTIVDEFALNAMILGSKRTIFQPLEETGGTIDIWWQTSAGGSLMTILAYLAQLDREWRKTELRIFLMPDSITPEKLNRLLDSARIKAQIIIIPDGVTQKQAVEEYSFHSELIFIELQHDIIHDKEKLNEFNEHVQDIRQTFPPFFLVVSNGEADLLA